MEAKTAKFKLDTYKFSKAYMDFGNMEIDMPLTIHFDLEGVFFQSSSKYQLKVVTNVLGKSQDESIKNLVQVECDVDYSFCSAIESKEIPDYFYSNSIAIIFPYIRAFIGTLSQLSNVQPLVLPTLNLTSLGGKLKERTKIEL